MTIKRREALALLAGATLAPIPCCQASLRRVNERDDGDALADIFAEMSTTGRAYLPGGTYKISKPLVIPPGVIEGGDVILDFRNANPADFRTGICVLVRGRARSKLPGLRRNLSIGARTFRFAGSHGLHAGDAFQLSGTIDSAGNGARSYYRKGEMFKVAEVIDSTSVTVANACRDSYPVDGTEVWKRAGDRFAQRCRSLTIIGHDGIDYAAEFESLDQSTVSNLRCENGRLAALSIADCYQMSGNNVRARQTAPGSARINPYGCVVGNSQAVSLRGECYGYFNGFSVGGRNPKGGMVGMNRDCHFEGKAGSDPINGLSGGNLHGNCEYCSLSGVFSNGISMGGNKNEAHGEFIKSGSPPIVLSELHGHDFKISGTLRTTGNVDLATNVGAVHQSGFGTNARYGGVTEINLRMYVPKATRILIWRPTGLARPDVKLQLALDIVKGHPKTRIIALKKNGPGGRELPLIDLARVNLIDNAVPIEWSLDRNSKLSGPALRAVTGQR